MRTQHLLALASPLMLSATLSAATETTTYAYDAQGRMQEAEHRRTGGGGYLDIYAHDRAANRSRIDRSGPFLGPTLNSPFSMPIGKNLLASDGRFRFVLQFDGNLVLYDQNDAVLWTNNTVGSGASKLNVQSDGNLVLYTAADVPGWHTHTNGNGNARLDVQDDGDVTLRRTADNVVIWHSDTCCH